MADLQRAKTKGLYKLPSQSTDVAQSAEHHKPLFLYKPNCKTAKQMTEEWLNESLAAPRGHSAVEKPNHKFILSFVSKITEITAGYTIDQLIEARNLAAKDYPGLVPLINGSVALARRSELDFSPDGKQLRIRKGAPRKSVPASDMHLFDLLQRSEAVPSNQDLSEFAARILPGMSRSRFSKVSIGDIATRIIEYLETLEPGTRHKLEVSMCGRLAIPSTVD